ncbi:hypothetical protein RRG08_017674 [Elysia crispata]|uniref:Uncharacterized protein n=1 Tax=Elysia crispata TaxID=231223 RepID=A0AAE0ZBF6_9GAST|nr:hypothetical protein RRG08_017674 [Elysia crispata]
MDKSFILVYDIVKVTNRDLISEDAAETTNSRLDLGIKSGPIHRPKFLHPLSVYTTRQIPRMKRTWRCSIEGLKVTTSFRVKRGLVIGSGEGKEMDGLCLQRESWSVGGTQPTGDSIERVSLCGHTFSTTRETGDDGILWFW